MGRAKAKHQIPKAMHYTVFLALVISLITTFLLGILLTQIMFSDGLGYFSELRAQTSISSASAAGTRRATGKLTAAPIDVRNYNVADNSDNVTIGSLQLSVERQPVTVVRAGFQLALDLNDDSDATFSDFTNIKLMNSSGTIIAGPFSVNPVSGVVMMTDHFTLPVGDHRIGIKADTGRHFSNGDRLMIELVSEYFKAVDASKGTNVQLLPRQSFVIANRTIKTASLVASIAPTPAAQSVYTGTSQFHATTVLLDASDSAHDIRVTAVDLAMLTDAPAFPSNISACNLYNGIAEVPVSSRRILYSDSGATPGGSATLLYTIPSGLLSVDRGTIESLMVKCDIGPVTGGSFSVGIEEGAIYAIDTSASSVDVTVLADQGSEMSIIQTPTTTQQLRERLRAFEELDRGF